MKSLKLAAMLADGRIRRNDCRSVYKRCQFIAFGFDLLAQGGTVCRLAVADQKLGFIGRYAERQKIGKADDLAALPADHVVHKADGGPVMTPRVASLGNVGNLSARASGAIDE